MSAGILDVWAALLRCLRPVWRPMLAVNLAYAVLGIVLLAPLPGLVLRLLMRVSGTPVLADQDIAYFLLTPFGVASLILVAGILVAIAVLAQASLMFIGVAGPGRAAPALAALAFAWARLVPILSFSVRLVARVLLLMAPFLAIGAGTAWLLITDHDINYYLSEQPPSFWLAALVIAGLLLAMLVLVVRKLIGWSLALPLILFGGVSPGRSFLESERLTQGGRSLVLGVLILWALIALLLGALGVGAVQGLGTLIVPRFHDALRPLVLVLGALVALWALLSFLIASFNGSTFALAIVELAERLGAPIGASRGQALDARATGPGWSVRAPRFAAVLALAGIIAAGTGAWLLSGIEVHDQVSIIGHRAGAGKAPENTLAAVRQAIADGVDWIEIDVQETADGEVVVVHDSDFMKLAGEPLKVWDGTLEQIRAIDAGGWFGPQFTGERVPTLREVLEMARGKSGVVIELKYYGHEQRLEQRVVDLVEAAGMTARVAIMSLSYEGIQRLRALRPDWSIGLLSAKAIGDLTRLDADFLAVSMGLATPGFVRHAKAAGKQVYVWTVNDPVSLSRMMSAGVDGVITDEPAMARQVMEQRGQMSPVERLLVHTALLFGRPLPQRFYRDDSP